MRRSSVVLAPLLASAAVALLSGCGPQMERCVDENNRVVDPAFCKNQTTTTSMPGHPFYRYYYGGSGSYGWGSTVSGGSFTPHSGTSYSFSSGTSSGGFGSSFSGGGHGGGGGE